MTGEIDRNWMRRALALAARGRGKTSPNPMVGAVLVKNGRMIAEGYHHAAGKPHAEVEAIRQAGRKARGATLYVTLEPCCHTGRTGPCTDAIHEAGIKEVVYASADPDRRVSGQGDRRLRELGLGVRSGVLEAEARRLNEIYFGYLQRRRPWVILKLAQTLDGRIATRTGNSQWISGPAALKLAHSLRAEVDAVVVGGNTFRRDNPSLTVRHVRGKDPFRIVMTRSTRWPAGRNLIDNNEDRRSIIATDAAAADRLARSKRARGLTLWGVKAARGKNSGLDPRDFLEKADAFGLRSLLIEGGASLATAFLKRQLVDRLVMVVAPKLLGSGIEAVGDLGITKLAQAIEFDDARFVKRGPDSVFVGYPRWKN